MVLARPSRALSEGSGSRLPAIVVLAALAAFGGSLLSAFHFDDYGMLQDHAVRSADGWLRCLGLYQTRPLTWLTFWANFQVSGRDPLLWHAVNLLTHLGCCAVLYRWLRRSMPAHALLATLIFAAHPIQSEPVDYVYARAIVLCTLFCLLSADAWFRQRDWTAVAWFAAALLAKEECVTLPLVLALAAWTGGSLGRRWPALAAMLGLAGVAGLRVVYAIQATRMQGIGKLAGITPLGYLAAQGIAILRYAGLLVLPWGFSVDPELPTAVWLKIPAWLLILTLSGICFAQLRTSRVARWILIGLILLIPSSSVFPVADLAADRRMYLPMIAFAPAIAMLIPSPSNKTWLALLLAALSIWRTQVWRSEERLWREAADQAPGKVRPRLQLARTVPAAEAAGILEEAARLDPSDPAIPAELARVELELGRPAEALGQAGRALALAPRDPHARNNRGAALLALGQTAAARRDFLAALETDPCLAEARVNLEHSGGVPGSAPACPAAGHGDFLVPESGMGNPKQ